MSGFLPKLRLPVAVAAVACVAALAPAAAQAAPIGAYTTKGAWSFVSAPGLHPPKLATDAKTQTNFTRICSGVYAMRTQRVCNGRRWPG